MFIGRNVLYTDETVNDDNLIKVLRQAYADHSVNESQIKYLYEYYKGNQPILLRKKDVRPEINNKIAVNIANEIINFKTSYFISESVQYISRDGVIPPGLTEMNNLMYQHNKSAEDKQLADWFNICGTSFRMVMPGDPFTLYTLDPRSTFVVYNSGLGHRPEMGVTFIRKRNGDMKFYVYTHEKYYEATSDKILSSTPHILGRVPIIEYPANTARLGAFEIVLPLLDALNEVTSDRMNGIEQFIQSLLMLKGVDISADDFAALRQQGGIKVPPDGDVKYLTSELNQTQTQTLVNNLKDEIYEICGMPKRNGSTGSTSDNGSAVIMRDGWSEAESRAKDSELLFKMSEMSFLELTAYITSIMQPGFTLDCKKVDIRIPRRNYENAQSKAQTLTTLLGSDKVHPKLAFEVCGLFYDPDQAYQMSKDYADEELAKEEASLNAIGNNHNAKS